MKNIFLLLAAWIGLSAVWLPRAQAATEEQGAAKPEGKDPGHLRMALINIKCRYSDTADPAANRANIQSNLDRHLYFIDHAAARGAEFIGFPELSINGYHFSKDTTWLSLDGPEVKALARKAIEKGVYLSVGMAEQDPAGAKWNTQIVIDPRGQVIGRHHKTWLTNEKGHVQTGADHNVFAVKGARMGIATCADGTDYLNLKALVDSGAQIIYGPHANTTGGTIAGWYKFRGKWGGPWDGSFAMTRTSNDGPEARAPSSGWIAQLKVHAALHNHAGLFNSEFAPPAGEEKNTGWASGAWFIGPDGRTLAQMPSSSQKADSLEYVLIYSVLISLAEGDSKVTQNKPPENLPADGFVRLRAPVLGLAIERNSATGVHRLVTVASATADRPTAEAGAGAATALIIGSLEECEARLVEELQKRFGRGYPNLATATLGGKQLWADVEILAGWRIQENVFTGHHRLLDPSNVRKAWGSYESCRTVLEAERVQHGLRPRNDHLVMVLHGLGRSRDSFAALTRALEAAGYEVAAVDYPSTRRELREHSLQIRGILDRLDGIHTVSFVTHSLGGIVVRDLLSLEGSWKDRIHVDRLVMIAPPNRGSVVAEALRDWMPARAILGDVLPELTPEEVAAIPPPRCEFGIIAGGTGKAKGLNPLIEGDNDGLVTVESTRLEGSRDFLLLDASHTFIMAKPACIEAAVRFLKTGRFAPGDGAPR